MDECSDIEQKVELVFSWSILVALSHSAMIQNSNGILNMKAKIASTRSNKTVENPQQAFSNQTAVFFEDYWSIVSK